MPAGGKDLPRPPYRDPLQQFRELMPRRLRRMLLVGSRYDFFLLWEDGQLSEKLLTEWLYLHLSSTSWITLAQEEAEARTAFREQPIDLVVLTWHSRCRDPIALARDLRRIRPQTPIVPLAFDDRELGLFLRHEGRELLHLPFLWQGDFNLLLGIVQLLEDQLNVEPDTRSVGVGVILVVEDGAHYYSSLLPLLYAELNEQAQRAIAEGTSLHHKVMRMRARPKILLCTTHEDAMRALDRHRDYLLGVISDMNFPRRGHLDAEAGLDLAVAARARHPDLPILLQTNDAALEQRAKKLRLAVVPKRSPTLLDSVRRFLRRSFGFGDFVFTDEDGRPLARAKDLGELEKRLLEVPAPVVRRHAEGNHFSTWLRARTEFELARVVRDLRVEEFESDEELRRRLADVIHSFREERQASHIAEFVPDHFHPRMSFARVGGGSIGGKARGLGFVRNILRNYEVGDGLEDVRIFVPAALVLATEIFDLFLESNDLRDFALECDDDEEIERRFLQARLPEEAREALLQFLGRVDYPLAVRSSSLLEDSQDFALSGAYATYMLPNVERSLEERMQRVQEAIKRIYASMFRREVKEAFRPSPYRLEEEKMAVILQRLVGTKRGERFYPDFSGVVCSHNFYPKPPMRPEDGIARVALGLGEAVVREGLGVPFCPNFPRHPIHFSTTRERLQHAQRHFYALKLDGDPFDLERGNLERYPIDAALEDGTLRLVGSIYVPEEDRIYPGVGRQGVPLVTFEPILELDLFPLAPILRLLVDVGRRATNLPVEIEFAVNFPDESDRPVEFAFLQLRPMAAARRGPTPDLDAADPERVVVESRMVLGHGVVDDIRDVVWIDREGFDRSRTREAAHIISEINALLSAEDRPYLLVGVGRFGSSDPWLGIPVQWNQICGARVLVEADFEDTPVAPSQGSHFFHNLATSGTGFFTVGGAENIGRVDWDWLRSLPVVERRGPVTHSRLDEPLTVWMDGRRGRGVILAPETARRPA